jgi:hypothetical protein
MFRSRRRKLECDVLEERALLSGVSGNVAAHAGVAPAHAKHAQVKHLTRAQAKSLHASIRSARAAVRAAEAFLAAQNAAPQAGTSSTGSIVGGGLITIGPAPTSQETDLFGQVAMETDAVSFLTQLEVLKGTTSNLQQASLSVLNDARNMDLLADNTASSLGIPIPATLVGSVRTTVQQAVTSLNGGQFEKAFATAMSSVGSMMVSQLQTMQGSGINSSLQTFATTALPIVQADMAALQAVANGGTSTLPTVSTTPSSSTLSSTDLNTLEASYSTNITERFLGQLTDLASNNLQVQLYGDKLIFDHEMSAIEEGNYAAATGTYLPPSIISSTDLSSAMQVLNAVPSSSGSSTSSYDRTYLQAMVSGHETDLSNNQQTITTTTNAALKQFAVDDMPTDLMHLNDAIYLMQQELAVAGSSNGSGSSSMARVRHVAS